MRAASHGDCHAPLAMTGIGHRVITTSQHMRIDLRRAYITMPELFLHAANIRTLFQQVRGEGVPQTMAARRFVNTRLAHREFHRAL